MAIVIGSGAMACGGSNEGDKGSNAGASGTPAAGGEGISLESFPGEYAEALCLLFDRCWQAFADAYEDSGQSCASYWELALREYAFSNLTACVNQKCVASLECEPEPT